MNKKLETLNLVITLLSGILSIVLLPVLADADLVPYYVALGAFFLFGLIFIWYFWAVKLSTRILVTVLGTLTAVILGYVYYQSHQPRFEITAFGTLEGDANSYEITDFLIWNQDVLANYRTNITFEIQVVPTYFGKRHFGKVVALISGDGGVAPVEKLIWDDFSVDASSETFTLTLQELLSASGIKKNYNPLENVLGPGDAHYEEASLVVQIANKGDESHPWATQIIKIRNSPWDQRSTLVWRNDERVIDVYIKNMGGKGEFQVLYSLARLDEKVGTSTVMINSGTTTLVQGREGVAPFVLAPGGYMTYSFPLPVVSAPGRYLVEVYSVKKQNYVSFTEPTITWYTQDAFWWFGRIADQLIFHIPAQDISLDPIIQAELDRLGTQEGIDLGSAAGVLEDVTSGEGNQGQRQSFDKGVIYIHDDQAYSLYGPVYQHLMALTDYEKSLFPISPIYPVTSSSGLKAFVAEFEPVGGDSPASAIYANERDAAWVEGWIARAYKDNGGYGGWLGLPTSDPIDHRESQIQSFEGGYIVYYFPEVDGSRDWNRAPVAFPYVAAQGTLYDVQADSWQDTSIDVQKGDIVTFIYVAGTWTDSTENYAPYDANGNILLGLQKGTLLDTANVGTLIGRIGNDEQQIFPVGGWRIITAETNGRLYLAMNDNSYSDNGGYITIQILAGQ